MEQMTFALFFGNRGFFPDDLISKARKELAQSVQDAGYKFLISDEDLTRYGAVETMEEGEKYAAFLKKNEGKYDGVILSLPNFGDESGAAVALKDCRVPILIQAFDDELDKMDPAHRRDAFCGKFSVMDVFYQMGLPFTIFKPHTLNPSNALFEDHIRKFASVCRIVKGMRSFNIGAFGARTTAFKTVRFDEIALQRYGINTETIDLANLFLRIENLKDRDRIHERLNYYRSLSDFSEVPEKKALTIAKLGLAIDEVISEKRLSAVAIRCWDEFQRILGISPCMIMSELNGRGIAASCEMDVSNAIAMRILALASGNPACVLDWNNNYGREEDKCIVFHCGSAANALLEGGAKIIGHKILENTLGKENCIGVNAGKLGIYPFTYASLKTDAGKLSLYNGEGEFTRDPVSEKFFGTYGVAKISNLQKVFEYIGKNGYKHHVSITKGRYSEVIYEALTNYLNYNVHTFN